jgi:thiazole synthase
MEEAILASASELVTVALKRIDLETETDAILKHLQHSHINHCHLELETLKKLFLLLNREALETNWLKLEIHPDPKYLMPDAIETLRATEN